jgi:drug/metabolite transporter (DMT)-like permease
VGCSSTHKRATAKIGRVLLLGVGAALLASVLFNVGIALQALEARKAPKDLNLRIGLLGRLFRRPLWVIGLALGGVGVAPQVLAFADAPFVVVQPALAVGLVLLLVLGSRTLGEHVGYPEVLGVAAIVVGVALVAWGAPPHSETHRAGLAVVGVVSALGVVAVAPFPLRGTQLDSPVFATVASGCGFGATNICTKLMSDDLGIAHYANGVVWALVGLGLGAAATITGMSAFQRRPATMVVPVSTAVQTFLPIVLEPLFLRERWSSADLAGAPIAGGLALALLGTILVTRTRAVSDLAAGAQQPAPVTRGRGRRSRRQAEQRRR